MPYKNILVPVDFSDINRDVLTKAIELKRDTDCTVVLVHIIDYLPPSHIWPELPEMYTSESKMTERAEKQITELTEEMGLSESTMIVRVGNPKEQILKIQQEQKSDLILMAKHSQKGLERLLGSTTNSVVQKAKCDVLVTHE